MKALILNDTRSSNHLGCILVIQQLESLCHEVGIEISAMIRFGRDFTTRVADEIPRCDVVIINGEGTMHHDSLGAMAIMEAGLLAADRGRPVALINTVWQENYQTNALLAKCSWIATRESLSRECIEKVGFAATVVPDLTLSADPERLFSGSKSTASPIVMDDVRSDLSLALARYASSRRLPFFPMGGRSSLGTCKGWEKFLKFGVASNWARQLRMGQVSAVRDASLIVTGRFHGICLAILARRPFVAFSSNTHKIEGLLRDANLGGGGRLFPDPPHAPDACKAYIDQASEQVSEYMQSPDNRAAYEEACEAYLLNARQSARSMLDGIARMDARTPC